MFLSNSTKNTSKPWFSVDHQYNIGPGTTIMSVSSNFFFQCGPPERALSRVDVRPRLNSFSQLYTVLNNGADVP